MWRTNQCYSRVTLERFEHFSFRWLIKKLAGKAQMLCTGFKSRLSSINSMHIKSFALSPTIPFPFKCRSFVLRPKNDCSHSASRSFFIDTWWDASYYMIKGPYFHSKNLALCHKVEHSYFIHFVFLPIILIPHCFLTSWLFTRSILAFLLFSLTQSFLLFWNLPGS